MVDSFPYKRYHLDAPAAYFRRAQAYHSTVEEKVLRSPADESRLLRPDSVVSKTSRAAFLQHFHLYYLSPPRQPRRAVIIRTPHGSYENINVLPDYYTEDARVRDTGAYQTVSPYEYWVAHEREIVDKVGDEGEPKAILHAQREYLYRVFPKEARQGKITNYLTLFSMLKSRIVLDPSAAWGDRLIAALASSTVEVYTGVDPHSRLPRGWQEILEELCPLSQKRDCKKNFVMLNEPFEPVDATPLPEMGRYDTVLVSTAPLVGDQYDRDNVNQAVTKHGSSYRSYVRGFLMPYLARCIEALKVGGYLCMTVLDRSRDNYHITELQLLLVELLADHVMKYVGVIWWSGDSGGIVPWWIFTKMSQPISLGRLEEARRLFQPYEEILGISL